MHCITRINDRINARKAIGKNFPLPRWLPILERNESNKVPGLWIRGAVGRSMKRDECSVLVTFGKLITTIEHQIVWRPMSWEAHEWKFLVVASFGDLAITTILRRKDLLSLHMIIEAVGPAIVSTFLHPDELLGRKNSVLPSCEYVRK